MCESPTEPSLRPQPIPSQGYDGPLERVDAWSYRIPRSYKSAMLVDGLIFADESLIQQVRMDQAAEQVANVACLPGIVGASLAMPDIHWGYGFCIGGVCATDPESGGVISPGGVGYDINCGVRLMRTNLRLEEVQPYLIELTDQLFRDIPAGIGRGGPYSFSPQELKELMRDGVAMLHRRGLATPRDLEHTEAGGCIENAAPENISLRALERGKDQCGTIGSGNHFLEIQVVDRVVDAAKAELLGISPGQICLLIHSGSRGLGYQTCDDALRRLRGADKKYGFALPDRQLACAPIASPEGEHYLGAMRAAANYAFCNRQLLMWQTRLTFERFFGSPWTELGMELIYDVAHNMAKFEKHRLDGQEKILCVHRKGATRAFPAGHPDIPLAYRDIGQPVIIPGDMGRASWLLVGGPQSMLKSFGTTCHGAGRRLSRTAAVRQSQGRSIEKELLQQGIVARAQSWRGLAEEQPNAYKDVDQVVEVVHQAGLSTKVARLRPLGVIKG
jgi:tRNA-splicing ligase RtcB